MRSMRNWGPIEPKCPFGNPTRMEVDEHNFIHCPYRSWCPVCVEAQGKDDPHYKSTREDCPNEAPVIVLDYKRTWRA